MTARSAKSCKLTVNQAIDIRILVQISSTEPRKWHQFRAATFSISHPRRGVAPERGRNSVASNHFRLRSSANSCPSWSCPINKAVRSNNSLPGAIQIDRFLNWNANAARANYWRFCGLREGASRRQTCYACASA